MKKVFGEYSLTIITIVSIIAIVGVFNVMFSSSIHSIFFKKKDSVNDISQTSNVINFSKELNISNSLEFNQDDVVENKINSLFKQNIKINDSYMLNDKLKENLKKITNNTLKKKSLCSNDCINSDNLIYSYYRMEDDYIVTVKNDNSNEEYIIYYQTKTGLFKNKKYKENGITTVDCNESVEDNNKLIKSEEEQTFQISSNYEISYLSKAEVNIEKKFTNNDSLVSSIYQQNINDILILNTYNQEVMIDSATGFFLKPGIIVTSWQYVHDSLKQGTNITAFTNNNDSYKVIGVITMNEELDIALLKIDEKLGNGLEIGNLEIGEESFMLGSLTGFGISGKIGVKLNDGDIQNYSFYVTKDSIGSPIFNSNGEVVSMVNSNSMDSSISSATSSQKLNYYLQVYDGVDFDDIKCFSFSELAQKYYKYNLVDERANTNILDYIWDKYKNVGKIEDTVLLKLVKRISFDNKISLRYKNDTGIDNDLILNDFVIELKNEGYKEKINSNKKKIYKSSNMKITIYYELNYIIIIMEEI